MVEQQDSPFKAKIEKLLATTRSNEEIVKFYDDLADTYEEERASMNSMAQYHTVIKALEFCPTPPDSAMVLDVGCGTGLVGELLKKKGFELIDGLDPSARCLEKAKERSVYKNLYCCYFTNSPLNIPVGTYDVLVTCGTFVRGHLSPECLPEMIRLVRPGGIICIVSRASSFDGHTVPEYKNIVPFINSIESSGRWRNLQWKEFHQYHVGTVGVAIVYEVLSQYD